jgi:hypothetical protein
VQEFPVLEKVAQKFAGERLVVLTINSDRRKKTITRVLDKAKTSLPVLRDIESEVFGAYRANVIPTIYLVDEQSVIYTAWMGSIRNLEEELGENIDFMVKHPAVAQGASAATEATQVVD